jgi:CRISPR system Cascade subunit CasC
MKHLELQILQSFPVSSLNRDDLNSPKTAIFGGVQWARVSSQAWKRAIRELARASSPSMGGLRTRLVVGGLVPLLRSRGFPEQASIAVAALAAGQLSNIDSKKDTQGFSKVTTLCFLSKQEFESIADAVAAKSELRRAASAVDKLLARAAAKGSDKKEDKEEIEKARAACAKLIARGEVARAIKAVQLKDAADIALFGRMVANDHSLMVEGAAMFSWHRLRAGQRPSLECYVTSNREAAAA